MKSFVTLPAILVRAINDRRGVTVIEYGLLAILIAIALVGVIGTTLEGSIQAAYSSVATSV